MRNTQSRGGAGSGAPGGARPAQARRKNPTEPNPSDMHSGRVSGRASHGSNRTIDLNVCTVIAAGAAAARVFAFLRGRVNEAIMSASRAHFHGSQTRFMYSALAWTAARNPRKHSLVDAAPCLRASRIVRPAPDPRALRLASRSVSEAWVQTAAAPPSATPPTAAAGFEWLGGDCASSLRLPSRGPNATLWLFGDTLLGTMMGSGGGGGGGGGGLGGGGGYAT